MSRDRAVREARKIKRLVEAKGVECVIDLKAGRPAPWDDWWCPYFKAKLGHHVVSRRSHGSTPFYRLVRDGRSGLPGPLSQFYIGFDGVFRIITLGLANHPGVGGPWRLPDGTVIPENNGRPYLVGTEVEGGIDWDDWTPGFRDLQARAFAGVLDWLGRDERSYGEHGAPWAEGRKVDRIRYYRDLPWARREIARHLATKEDDDMPPLRRGMGVAGQPNEQQDDWVIADLSNAQAEMNRLARRMARHGIIDVEPAWYPLVVDGQYWDATHDAVRWCHNHLPGGSYSDGWAGVMPPGFLAALYGASRALRVVSASGGSDAVADHRHVAGDVAR